MLTVEKKIKALTRRYELAFEAQLVLGPRHANELLLRFRQELADVVSGRMYEIPEQAEELVAIADEAIDHLENTLRKSR